MGTRTDPAARWLGAGMLGVSFALALTLVGMIPPSQLGFVASGLAVTTLCGLLLLVRGLQRWAAVTALVLGCSLVATAALTVRASSDELRGLTMSLRADDARCMIDLRGDLRPDLYHRLRNLLDEHPQTRALVLNSAGGSALAVEKVAALLRERGVGTAAIHGQCDSACAFLWVSAPQRVVLGTDRNSGAGFHAPHVHVPGFGRVRAHLQEARQRDYLERAGLPASFIGWAYAPLAGAWRPDIEQLRRVGVPAQFIEAGRLEDVSFCTVPPQVRSQSRPAAAQRRAVVKTYRHRRLLTESHREGA